MCSSNRRGKRVGEHKHPAGAEEHPSQGNGNSATEGDTPAAIEQVVPTAWMEAHPWSEVASPADTAARVAESRQTSAMATKAVGVEIIVHWWQEDAQFAPKKHRLPYVGSWRVGGLHACSSTSGSGNTVRSASPGLQSKLSCFQMGDDDDDDDPPAASGGGRSSGSSSSTNGGRIRQSAGPSAQLKPKSENGARSDRSRTWPDLTKGFSTPERAAGVLRGMMMIAARSQAGCQQQGAGGSGQRTNMPDMPADFERQLMDQHYSVTELLRHHYANSQQPSTEARRSKLQRINVKLESKLNELDKMKQILRQDSR